MANDYLIAQDIKDAMPDSNWGTKYDAIFTGLATAASRAIDRFTGRSPGVYYVTADTTYYYNGPGGHTSYLGTNNDYLYDNRLGGLSTPNSKLWIDEIAAAPTSVAMALTGDITNYTALATTDYILWPYNALNNNAPYQRLDLDMLYGSYRIWYSFPKGIKVVGKFGYSQTVPAEIKQACLIQAIRWFKRGQNAFQDVMGNINFGFMQYMRQLDPDVEAIIMHYRRLTI